MVVVSMGTVRMSQMWMLRWVILLMMGLQSIQAGYGMDHKVTDSNMFHNTEAVAGYGMDHRVTVFPDMRNMIITTVVPNPDHQATICSTWGNFHFKSFDGHFFEVPDACNYILAEKLNKDFNIEMQRKIINSSATFSKIKINLQSSVIELTNDNVKMDNKVLYNATYKDGIAVKLSASSVTISDSRGVNVFWEKGQSLMIELKETFRGQTRGLCGNFNGNKTDDSFDLSDWKVLPTEACEGGNILPNNQCINQSQTNICQQYLSSPGFSDCYRVLDMSSFKKSCEDDLCRCFSKHDCLCNTLTEISRQCTHAGGKPGTWRTEELCPKTCPMNMQYMECGGPCISTCSVPDAAEQCKEHCVDGCFCPEGTVKNDIGPSGCIPVNECPCMHNDKIYSSGTSYTEACTTCNCTAGRWTCTNMECPGICSIVGGSHVTTYDGKTFTFSGNCDYMLTKHSNDSDIAVVGNLAQCGWARSDTCLNSVTIVISGTTIRFSSSGDVTLNGSSPYKLPSITATHFVVPSPVSIFKPSSSFIIADMKSLRLEIQLAPVMQLYIIASTEEKGKMSGLCGNYNDVQSDDFKIESGITEDTAIPFVNFWKKRTECQKLDNTFVDPCSLHLAIEKLAKDWCSRLTNKSGVFSACHSEISPKMYYQWCVYDTCKCADIKGCMCAAISNYAHACAARGIILQGWMDPENCVTKCLGNMKYSYGVTSCGRTCRSLSGLQTSTCQGSFTPVHGCVCPKDTYLNDDGTCVTADQCPCYHGNQIIKPSETIDNNGVKCTCKLGKLHCASQKDCAAPMVFFNCSNHEQGHKGTECQRTCEKQDPNNCVSTGCVSGCMCPDDLLVNGKGQCVEREKCTCDHNGKIHSPGEQVHKDCNIW
ncbi:LOW QUALITY PROTEIN: mucin-5B-like [Labeo rohita]|uniref:LOW QUALITY PROTEIN: mucin-5B-like n=1 Tax=Labeo rohita TaxID=84645 RepID=UPI0021E1E8AD|nr:LOW QUALITY PROTEIN: mucin-5B-like [Labeo rohita]